MNAYTLHKERAKIDELIDFHKRHGHYPEKIMIAEKVWEAMGRPAEYRGCKVFVVDSRKSVRPAGGDR